MALISIEPRNIWLRRVLGELGIELPVFKPVVEQSIFSVHDDGDDGDDEKYLKNLDPRKWKEQDHYRILGLKHRRYLATEDEIKKAYKRVVLAHHPDKRHGEAKKNEDDDYFSCITKAFQILGDPIKRQSYDSVDEYFDNEIPPVNAASKANFFSVFGPVFERNARWSTIQPVPLLGHISDSKEKVEKFYNFWYNFDSWREYSYLDEEDKQTGQDRVERKWIERQNKVERQKKKKEEMIRIRQLVDNAYACDSRILKFKEDAKTKKLMEKKAKEAARKQKQEEEERSRKEEEYMRLKKEREEEEKLKEKREQERKEKDAIKKQRKKNKKLLESFFEDNNYFAVNDKEKIMHVQELNKIFLTFDNEELTEFREKIVSTTNSPEESKQMFLLKINHMHSNRLNQEKPKVINSTQDINDNSKENENNSTKTWSPEDLQLLIKGVNLFPAGTQDRWDVIAAFVNQHTISNNKNRKAREVLAKAKDLSKIDMGVKQELNKVPISKLLESGKNKAKIEDGPSQRYDTPADENNAVYLPWSKDEQQLLEQALKTYPSSHSDRWDRIAECIPGRSKKDCMRRYKELVELVKAKKAAQEAVRVGVKK